MSIAGTSISSFTEIIIANEYWDVKGPGSVGISTWAVIISQIIGVLLI